MEDCRLVSATNQGEGLNDNGYTSGGILNSPPQQISSSEVDEILNQAYDEK